MPLFNANRQFTSGLESSLPFIAVDGSESTTPIALAHCHLIITMNLLKRLGGLGPQYIPRRIARFSNFKPDP
jgi:hypothetical protein